jgi:hypothetical protein
MRYRKLSPYRLEDGTLITEGDYVFGNGDGDFWHNTPEAPAQAVMTRLRFKQGDWFLDLNDGTPWDTRVKGKRTDATRDMTIRLRVIQTQGVTGIPDFSSNLNHETRAYSVNMTIDTVYGQTVIEGPL